MGMISRHAGAPFADGETLAGADLEGDFATVYAAVNGNLDSTNLADGAVTTPKLAANAVTQAKMTSGAATASDVLYSASTLIDTTATIIISAVSHTVGNPARHVIVTVSFAAIMAAGEVWRLGFYKDGVVVGSAPQIQNPLAAATYSTIMTRTWVDTSPTPGGTHSYAVKGQTLATHNQVLTDAVITVVEPRS